MPDPIQGVNAGQPLDVAQPGQTGSSATSAAATAARGAGAVDSADVARAEALLASILDTAKTVPDIDQTRVAELRRAVQSGEYQVNPQQIAERIMEIEQLLATRGP